jgi:outer membrane protein OmpA-like peptidoglycan-associated protein
MFKIDPTLRPVEETVRIPSARRSDQGVDISNADLNTLLTDIGIRVHFEEDKATVSASEILVVKNWAAWLKKHPALGALLEGHRHIKGTAEYNLALGERQSKSVRDLLILEGIEASRVSTISYGKERLEERQDSVRFEEAGYINRRVTFVPYGRE